MTLLMAFLYERMYSGHSVLQHVRSNSKLHENLCKCKQAPNTLSHQRHCSVLGVHRFVQPNVLKKKQKKNMKMKNSMYILFSFLCEKLAKDT